MNYRKILSVPLYPKLFFLVWVGIERDVIARRVFTSVSDPVRKLRKYIHLTLNLPCHSAGLTRLKGGALVVMNSEERLTRWSLVCYDISVCVPQTRGGNDEA